MRVTWVSRWRRPRRTVRVRVVCTSSPPSHPLTKCATVRLSSRRPDAQVTQGVCALGCGGRQASPWQPLGRKQNGRQEPRGRRATGRAWRTERFSLAGSDAIRVSSKGVCTARYIASRSVLGLSRRSTGRDRQLRLMKNVLMEAWSRGLL